MNGGMTTTWYIHNSYIWFALKLGLAGALVFVALLAAAVEARLVDPQSNGGHPPPAPGSRGARDSGRASPRVPGGPHLNGDSSTPYIAAVIALIELVPRLETTARRTRRASTRSREGSTA